MTAVRIPLFDTHAVIAELRAEFDARIAAVIDSGRFIGGPEVEAFERERVRQRQALVGQGACLEAAASAGGRRRRRTIR